MAAEYVIQDLQRVYRLLEDAESRDIYRKRLDYLVTDDFKYMKEVIKTYTHGLGASLDERIKASLDSLPDGKEFVLYGAGKYAAESAQFTVDGICLFLDHKRFAGFCSKTVEKQKNGYLGCPVMSPEELFTRRDLCVIVFAIDAREEILQQLREADYPEELIFDGQAICDQAECEPDMYFNPDFMRFEDEEVFIDVGCYDLATSLKLREYCKKLNVYAFEPDAENYALCLTRKEEERFKTAKIFPMGTWSERAVLSFQSQGNVGSHVCTEGSVNSTISVVPIDEVVDDGVRVTMIKMDTEGSELESLKGARATILRDKPKLAISMYHKPEDMVAIPLYINDLVPEYKFYIRHHSNAQYDTVLYAVIP